DREEYREGDEGQRHDAVSLATGSRLPKRYAQKITMQARHAAAESTAKAKANGPCGIFSVIVTSWLRVSSLACANMRQARTPSTPALMRLTTAKCGRRSFGGISESN